MNSSSPWAREVPLHLVALGHEITVIDMTVTDAHSYISSRDPSQTADVEKFSKSVTAVETISSSLNRHVAYALASRELRRILNRRKPDVLLVLYGGGLAMTAYLSGFRPYAVYLVGSDVLIGNRAKKFASRFALQAAAALFVNGQHLTAKTTEIAPRSNPQCLYLGTNISKFSLASPAPGPVKIVCTRGFSKIYNNEYLIRALHVMHSITQPFRLIFAAAGPLLDRVRTLADQILPAAVRQSVEFLGGVSRDHMATLLREAHIYVSVSRSDGTSLSLMEGLACGLFPVVSDIPANREWVLPDSQNGILVPLDEPRALAAALARAISDPTLRSRSMPYNRELITLRADSRVNMAILADYLQRISSSA